ncbi:sensor histidine kinase [Dyella nitratireducens]|uniref:histidine kinase n=1 Tax=Dyella nitratireducens TaxID=1849580 RepID=A0ABQ1FMY2_9GAMM|nr:HAMP domain-containing sensor histidine kinase [Dyella nitratireducens]GGA23115.1 two-component sensor histidine kinase [Dyella nitratireducens]GLQ44013.1 two-component sensor histidine kinase [Dyella nitratireducens]
MQSRRKLRFRLLISFALFGFGLSALFAAASLYVRAKVENQLVNASLQSDVDQAVENAHSNPGQPVGSRLIDAWMWSDRTIYKAPLGWQNLATGVYDMHDVDKDGHPRHYKLAVARKYGLIGFISYDISREDLGKRQLITSLIASVILFSLLSLAIGMWLSRKVLKPVTELAHRLRDFRKAGRAELLAPHFADDEVGELAQALDEYSTRLTAMVERDREFNSDVSHELRTPLAVISSTTELLQGSPDLTDKLRERLKRIERASRQATELIEALLLLSRAERRGPTRGEITDIAKVATDVIDSQRPQIRDKPIEVELLQNDSVTVNAPASVLSVALTNLIGNAIKYTLEGRVTVEVGKGRIDIIDTGPGIKPEDAERLFQRGVRGEGAGGSGAGLGLAIVRRLCELYGWDVSMKPRTDANGAIASIVFER